MKRRRQIIQIDESKCNGCGLCITACAEGALQLVDGKAKLVKDIYCDGLGACLGECPEGAIQIIEREAEDFDAAAVNQHLAAQGKSAPTHGHAAHAPHAPAGHAHHAHGGAHGGCPGSALRQFHQEKLADDDEGVQLRSHLSQWPVQLSLVPPFAPYLQGADLLICADCVPFAVPDFHRTYLKGRAVLVGCPKLDDLGFYREKLEDVFRTARPKSVTVLRMEVPCCGGIAQVAIEARDAAGLDIPLEVETIGIQGGARRQSYPAQAAAAQAAR